MSHTPGQVARKLGFNRSGKATFSEWYRLVSLPNNGMAALILTITRSRTGDGYQYSLQLVNHQRRGSGQEYEINDAVTDLIATVTAEQADA